MQLTFGLMGYAPQPACQMCAVPLTQWVGQQHLLRVQRTEIQQLRQELHAARLMCTELSELRARDTLLLRDKEQECASLAARCAAASPLQSCNVYRHRCMGWRCKSQSTPTLDEGLTSSTTSPQPHRPQPQPDLPDESSGSSVQRSPLRSPEILPSLLQPQGCTSAQGDTNIATGTAAAGASKAQRNNSAGPRQGAALPQSGSPHIPGGGTCVPLDSPRTRGAVIALDSPRTRGAEMALNSPRSAGTVTALDSPRTRGANIALDSPLLPEDSALDLDVAHESATAPTCSDPAGDAAPRQLRAALRAEQLSRAVAEMWAAPAVEGHCRAVVESAERVMRTRLLAMGEMARRGLRLHAVHQRLWSPWTPVQTVLNADQGIGRCAAARNCSTSGTGGKNKLTIDEGMRASLPSNKALFVDNVCFWIAAFVPKSWAPVCSKSARAVCGTTFIYAKGWLHIAKLLGRVQSKGAESEQDRGCFGPEPGCFFDTITQVRHLREVGKSLPFGGNVYWQSRYWLYMDFFANLVEEMRLRHKELFLAARVYFRNLYQVKGTLQGVLAMHEERTGAVRSGAETDAQ